MAKTTSQIVAENKKKREGERQIDASRNEIHKKQMASVGDHAAKTAAVLKKAYASTTDSQKKGETNSALKRLQNAYGTTNKTAVDKLWDRQSTPRQRTEQDEARSDIVAAKRNTEQKQKELEDYQNTDYDWTDAAARELYEKGEQQKKQEIAKAQAEQNAAVANFDRIQMNAMSEEDRALIDEYIRREDTASDPLATGTEAIVEHFVNQNTGIDEKRLKQMVETRRRELNAQRMQETQRKAQEAVNSGVGSTVLHNALTIPANLMSGLMGTMSTIHGLANRDERYSGLDPNSMGNELNVYSGAVRGQTQQNIVGTEEERAAQIASLVSSGYSQSEAEFIVNKGRQGLAALYQAVMSAADTGARALAGGALGLGAGAGATIAGLNTFSQTMADASARGATPEQALMLAVTTAGIEAATEKVPLDNLIKVSKGGGAKSLIMNILRQAGIEATEEELSLIGTTLADAAIMQEKSEYNQTVAEYMAQGMTEEQAREQANWGLIQEAGETALVSGIAGGIGGFGAAKVAAFSQDGLDTTTRQAAQQTQTAQNPQDVNVDAQQEAAVQAESDGLTDAQRFAKAAEEARKAGGDINQALQQTGDEYADMMPAQKPEAKTQEQIALEDGIQKTIQANQEQGNSKKREKEVYDALKSAKKDQKDLQKEIDRAETRLRETGKGSPARIEQLKAKLEQQNKLVSRIESQYQYFNGEYARNISDAVSQQREIFAAAKDRAAQAMSDFEAGKITEAQKNAEVDAYNKAGAELKRLSGMTQEQYRAELADVGLVADFEGEPEHATPDYNQTSRKRVYSAMREGAKETGIPEFKKNKQKRVAEQNANMGKEAGVKPAGESPKNAPLGTPVSPVSADGMGRNGVEVKQNTDNTEILDSAPQVDTQEVSVQDGQEIPDGMKGTGAAEQNSDNKAVNNTVPTVNNLQDSRSDDVRTMNLPKQDVNGGDVSAVTGNVYGSKITPDEFASLMEEPTAKGDFSYVKLSNDKATELAKQRIERSGDWQTAYVQWAKAVERGEAGAEMTARGALLLNKAAQDGDKAQWIRVLADMQSLGTNTAQGLQAFRLVRTLSTPDKLEFAKATVKKMVEKMNLRNDIVIDEGLLNAYENAQTDAQRNEIIEKIQQNVADQIPSNVLDKFNALRYLNMLGNLKTVGRNVFGNVGAKAAYRVKDTIAASFEKAAYKLSGGKTELTKSVFVNSDLKKAAAKDFDQFAGIIGDGGKFSVTGSGDGDFAQGVMDKRTIFKFKPLEMARKASNWSLNNKYFGDEAFGRAAYARALAGYLQANGVKDTDLSKVNSDLMNKARAYAVKQAQEATFHDNNTVSRTLVKLQRNGGVVGQGILPFAKTPANVLVRAEEFSPLGFINSTLKTIQAAAGNSKAADSDGIVGKWARNGHDITGADLIDSWAKSFTGAGLFVLGAWLKDMGWLTGGPDEDDDKAAFDRLNGMQPYALMLPNGWNITFDFLSPVAMPMFMGAQASKLWSEGGEFTYEKLEKIATSLSDPMLQMSFLQGVDNSLNDIKYTDNNLGQFFINACVNYLAQGLTSTLGGQIERSFEKERMTTYVDKDSGIPDWMQKQLGKASQKIPGWDYQQTPYINSRGETEKNIEGFAGILYNFASPGYIDKKEIDAVSEELYRLNETAAFDGNIFPDSPATSFDYTGKDGIVHKDFNLSAEQADNLKRVTGQTGTKILSEIIKTTEYSAMTDQQKAEAVKLAYQYAQEKGRCSALDDYPELSGWMAGIDGKEAKTIAKKVHSDTLDRAIEDLTTAWVNGWDDNAKRKGLNDAYSALSGMPRKTKNEILAESSATVRNYAEARDAGISNKKYVDILKQKAAAQKRKGGDLNQSETIEILSGVTGVSDSQKELLFKADLSDTQDENIDQVKAFVEENGLSQNYLKLYVEAYDIAKNYTKGNGKKNRTISHIMKMYGLSWGKAKELYEIFN